MELSAVIGNLIEVLARNNYSYVNYLQPYLLSPLNLQLRVPVRRFVYMDQYKRYWICRVLIGSSGLLSSYACLCVCLSVCVPTYGFCSGKTLSRTHPQHTNSSLSVSSLAPPLCPYDKRDVFERESERARERERESWPVRSRHATLGRGPLQDRLLAHLETIHADVADINVRHLDLQRELVHFTSERKMSSESKGLA